MLDFQELKTRVSIEQVLSLLRITAKAHGSQLRTACPICKNTDQRSFVVTPAKNLFYCFSGCGGGDQLKLVSKMLNCDIKAAAQWISEQTGTAPSGGRTVPPEQKAAFQPLTYLEASHEALAGLGVEASTFEAFGAGYAPKGILRGRLAIPIHDRKGSLLAYCGRALKGENPLLTFPSNFTPSKHLFNLHRIERGDIAYVVNDPLQVLKAAENGVTNVIATLGDITADTLEALAIFMHENETPSIELLPL